MKLYTVRPEFEHIYKKQIRVFERVVSSGVVGFRFKTVKSKNTTSSFISQNDLDKFYKKTA